MATVRVIRPEILDGLAADDPSAMRARLDLRWINVLMGNRRWVKRALRRALRDLPNAGAKTRFVELGAGDGRLCRKVFGWFPQASITGLDLAPRPPGLPEAIFWRQGDLFEQLPNCIGDTLIAVMILHHFSDERLTALGRMLQGFKIVCLCETWRVHFPHFLGAFIRPFCGKVTRHDLHVSIDAGFLLGELPSLLSLSHWQVKESVDWRGSLRVLAWRE
jgi:hypothetical protein